MDGPHLDNALQIKNNALRDWLSENIYARRIAVGNVATEGPSIDFLYEEGTAGSFVPVVRNVDNRNLRVE
jgi:hypothetical protein